MYQQQQSQLKIKIVLIGECSTGKTNIKNRLCNGIFTQYSNPTVGLQLANRKFWSMFNNKEVLYDLVCWDIGANIYDRTVLPSYFRNAMGVIYVYDISRRETFEKLQSWRETVIKYMNTQHYTEMVMGNKIDLLHFREVMAEEGQKWAIMKRIQLFFEVSALQNANIESSVQKLSLAIVEKFDESIKIPVKLKREEARHRGCIYDNI